MLLLIDRDEENKYLYNGEGVPIYRVQGRVRINRRVLLEPYSTTANDQALLTNEQLEVVSLISCVWYRSVWDRLRT